MSKIPNLSFYLDKGYQFCASNTTNTVVPNSEKNMLTLQEPEI